MRRYEDDRAVRVSRSACCRRVKRGVSDRRTRADAELTAKLRAIQREHHGRYGSQRMHADMRKQGISVSRKRTAGLMRENGLNAKRRAQVHSDYQFELRTSGVRKHPGQGCPCRRYLPRRSADASAFSPLNRGFGKRLICKQIVNKTSTFCQPFLFYYITQKFRGHFAQRSGCLLRFADPDKQMRSICRADKT
jgi:hypothetical protein